MVAVDDLNTQAEWINCWPHCRVKHCYTHHTAHSSIFPEHQSSQCRLAKSANQIYVRYILRLAVDVLPNDRDFLQQCRWFSSVWVSKHRKEKCSCGIPCIQPNCSVGRATRNSIGTAFLLFICLCCLWNDHYCYYDNLPVRKQFFSFSIEPLWLTHYNFHIAPNARLHHAFTLAHMQYD